MGLKNSESGRCVSSLVYRIERHYMKKEGVLNGVYITAESMDI